MSHSGVTKINLKLAAFPRSVRLAELARRAEYKGSDSLVGSQARNRPASSAEHPLAEHFMCASGERVGRVDDPDLLVGHAVAPGDQSRVVVQAVPVRRSGWLMAYYPPLGKTPRVKMDGFRVPLVTRCS